MAADGSVLPPIDPVMDDEGDKFHKGDVAVLAAEGNTVQLGLQNVRLEVGVGFVLGVLYSTRLVWMGCTTQSFLSSLKGFACVHVNSA